MTGARKKTTPGRPLLLGAAGIVGIIVLLLIPVKKIPDEGWLAGAWNLQHLPGFFLFTRCIHAVLRGLRASPRHAFLAALLALVAAVGSELLQALVGRSASLEDVTLDAFGVALATLWPYRPARFTPARRVAWFAVLLGGVLFAFAPAIRLEMAVRDALGRLPALGDFQKPSATRVWRAQGATTRAVRDGALQVDIRPGTYGGVHYLPGTQDWSPYTALALAFTNPGPALRLGVRIDDAGSARDRVWHADEIHVPPGDSEVRIPLPRALIRQSGREARPLDLTRVRRLLLFVDKTESAVHFSLRSATLITPAEPNRP